MFSIEDVVMRLVGHVNFFGETDYDNRSLDNLSRLIELESSLNCILYDVSNSTDGRPQASAMEIHKRITQGKKQLMSELNDIS